MNQGTAFTRRRLLGSACALAASSLHAQPQTGVIRYREYARCLPDYLSEVAADANADYREQPAWDFGALSTF